MTTRKLNEPLIHAPTYALIHREALPSPVQVIRFADGADPCFDRVRDACLWAEGATALDELTPEMHQLIRTYDPQPHSSSQRADRPEVDRSLQRILCLQ